LATAERTARAAAEARQVAEGGRRRRGRPLQAPTDPASVAAAEQAAAVAIDQADGVATVQGWVQEALRPVAAATGRARRPPYCASWVGWPPWPPRRWSGAPRA
jgi:hypothetical protein